MTHDEYKGYIERQKMRMLKWFRIGDDCVNEDGSCKLMIAYGDKSYDASIAFEMIADPSVVKEQTKRFEDLVERINQKYNCSCYYCILDNDKYTFLKVARSDIRNWSNDFLDASKGLASAIQYNPDNDRLYEVTINLYRYNKALHICPSQLQPTLFPSTKEITTEACADIETLRGRYDEFEEQAKVKDVRPVVQETKKTTGIEL